MPAKLSDQRKSRSNLKTIRFMYVSKGLQSKETIIVRVSILTTAGEFIEYQMGFIHSSINYITHIRLSSLFSDFLLVPESEVLISKNVERFHPVLMYLMFVRHHVNFNMTTKSMDDIVRRICKYHRGITKQPLMKVDSKYLNRVWNFLVEKKRCPWITETLDRYISRVTMHYKRREHKIMRVAIYYMFIKMKYHEINVRAARKKEALLAMQQSGIDEEIQQDQDKRLVEY